MKKFFFLAALALSAASAWAQKVTGTDDSVFTEGWYQIQVASGSAQAHATYKDYYLSSYIQNNNGNNWIGLRQDGTDANTYVYITGSHDNFHMEFFKGGTGNFAAYYAAGNTTKTTTAGSLKFIPSADGQEWKIWGINGDREMRWMGWTLGGPALGSTSTSSTAYDNCYFTFTKVNLTEASLPEVGKKYRLALRKANGSRVYITSTGVSSDVANADFFTVETSTNETYPLQFKDKDGHYLTSHGVKSDVAANDGRAQFSCDVLKNSTSQYVVCPTAVRYASLYLNASQRYGNIEQIGNMILKESDNTFNNSNAPYMNGSFTSAIEIEEVPDNDVTVTYTIVHDGKTLGTKTVLEQRGAAPTVSFPSYVEATDLPTTVETDAITVNTTYNSTMPFETEKPYYLKFIVSGSGTYWWYNADAAKELKDNGPESGNEAKAQWIIGGDWLNGYTFQSRYNDKYVTSPAATATNVQAQLTTDATDLSRFELLHKTGQYTGFYFQVKNGNACLAHTSASDLNLSLWNDATYRGNIVTFVKVPESFDVAVSDAGYATLYYGEALTIPSGVKAYTIKVEGDYAVATEVTGTIPSKTAVVLQAEENSYTFPTTLSEAFAGENDLEGALTATATPTGCLTLAVENGVPGFYKYTGETVAANKAYYIASSEAASNLRISFGELTSIISAAQENGGQAIFDLQGRRVVNAQNGLFIQNGKKVIK